MSKVLAIDLTGQDVVLAELPSGSLTPNRLAESAQVSRSPLPCGLTPDHAVELGNWLSMQKSALGFKAKDVVITLPRSRVTLPISTVPPCPEGELPAIVQFEVENECDDPSSNYAVDFQINARDEQGRASQVIGALVSDRLIDTLTQAVKIAGLNLLSIGVRPHASYFGWESVRTSAAPQADEAVLLLVPGSETIEASIWVNNTLQLVRTAPTGGSGVGRRLTGLIGQMLAAFHGRAMAKLGRTVVAGQLPDAMINQIELATRTPVECFGIGPIEQMDVDSPSSPKPSKPTSPNSPNSSAGYSNGHANGNGNGNGKGHGNGHANGNGHSNGHHPSLGPVSGPEADELQPMSPDSTLATVTSPTSALRPVVASQAELAQVGGARPALSATDQSLASATLSMGWFPALTALSASALAGAGQPCAIDLLNPKKPVVVRKTSKRTMVLAGLVALLLPLGVVGGVKYKLHQQDQELARVRKQLKTTEDDLKKLEPVVRRHQMIAEWKDSEIHALNELADLSGSLPDTRHLFLTSLEMNAGTQGRESSVRLNGRAKGTDVVYQTQHEWNKDDANHFSPRPKLLKQDDKHTQFPVAFALDLSVADLDEDSFVKRASLWAKKIAALGPKERQERITLSVDPDSKSSGAVASRGSRSGSSGRRSFNWPPRRGGDSNTNNPPKKDDPPVSVVKKDDPPEKDDPPKDEPKKAEPVNGDDFLVGTDVFKIAKVGDSTVADQAQAEVKKLVDEMKPLNEEERKQKLNRVPWYLRRRVWTQLEGGQ